MSEPTLEARTEKPAGASAAAGPAATPNALRGANYADGARSLRPPTAGPDLTVRSVAFDKPIVRAITDGLGVTAEVENQGSAEAASVPLLTRLSPDGAAAADTDLRLDDLIRFDKRPLPPGERRRYTMKASSMPGVADTVHAGGRPATRGAWHLGVTADPGNLVAEGDETNNTGWAADTLKVTDKYGNGAVDPRLGYTAEAKAQAATLDNVALPVAADGHINSRETLEHWTQIDGADANAGPASATDTDELRCGPTTAVAAALMQGRSALYRLAWRVSDKGSEKLNALTAGPSDAASAKRQGELSTATGMAIGVLSEISDPQKTTYGTLSRLAHSIKVIMTADKEAAATGHEMLEILGLSGPAQPAGYGHVTDEATFNKALDALELGQKYHVIIDTDVRLGHRTDYAQGEVNHWVMIAAVGTNKAKPRIVLYDPYPREGGQLMFRDEPGFSKPFKNDPAQGGAFRGCIIATKSGAGVK